MAAAVALAERARGSSKPNPNVACLIVDAAGRLVGRGVTAAGGRPHAEAAALAMAGQATRGATAYVTLEPCAHSSTRGPACTDSLIAAGVARVVTALTDPDPRTAGQGHARLSDAGIMVTQGVLPDAARRSLLPWWIRTQCGRPTVTLKLALSADGRIARPADQPRWITGSVARAHGHIERTRHDVICVGRGTLEADAPQLDVRLPGLESRSPRRVLLSGSAKAAPDGWTLAREVDALLALPDAAAILIEGGAGVAASVLRAGVVDTLLLYRAPDVVVGAGDDVATALGLPTPDTPHPAWTLVADRALGSDRLSRYERADLP